MLTMQFILIPSVDASEFLRKHPWPGRAIVDTFDDSNHRQSGHMGRFVSALNIMCGRTGEPEDVYDDYEDQRVVFDYEVTPDVGAPNPIPFYWSQELQQSFRDELEKSVLI